ncbi:MAG: prolipoprotein diacylglyceryl transferase [Solirubrobacterales bacterium]|nr:prolipoprotein diacylglyceryl transferase [Solirubrobacterales bacterium]
MTDALGVITIGIAPEFDVGPLTVAWHGLTIAIGILLGGLVAGRYARSRGLDAEPLYTIGAILAGAALVGGRVFFLAEHGRLLEPAAWIGNTGFTFNGGFIAAAAGIALYLWRSHRTAAYLDVVAVGLPLGVAVGRVGDVINGEHYGSQTTFFLGVRNTHPDALTPNPDLAYHNGGLYEVLLGTAIFGIVWPLRHRLTRTTALRWLVLALFAVGRFFEFFARSDSEDAALGLSTAQWTSVVLVIVAAVGAWWTLWRRPRAYATRT